MKLLATMKLNVISLKIYVSQIFLAAKSYNLFSRFNSVRFNYISLVPSTILTLFLKPRILQNVEEYHNCHYIDVPVRYSKRTRTSVPWSIDKVSSHWNHSIMPALSQSPFLVLRGDAERVSSTSVVVLSSTSSCIVSSV